MLELKYVIWTSQPPVFWFQIPHLSLDLFSFPFLLLYSAVWYTAQGVTFAGSMEFCEKGVWAVKSQGPGGRFWIVVLNRRRNCFAACSCSAVQPRDAAGNRPKGCRWGVWALDTEVWTSLLQKSLSTTFLLKNGSQLDLISALQLC